MNLAEFAKLVKFGITGVMNTLVDYLVFMLLAWKLGVNADLSQVSSYSAGMLNSYLVNRKWTFGTKQRLFSLQMLKFVLANLVVLAVSILLLRFFTGLQWPLQWAKLATIGATMALNFIISRLWVFR